MKNAYLIFISLLLISPVLAQPTHSLSGDSNILIIKGTSSVHDWESTAEKIYGEAILILNEGKLEGIKILSFSVETKSIQSGKRIMDSKTKDALKEKEHSLISFNLTEVVEITTDSITVFGTLSLAGMNQKITLNAAYKIEEGGNLKVTGVKPIDMEEFGVNPPSAMLGALKTGKDVEVDYSITFQKN